LEQGQEFRQGPFEGDGTDQAAHEHCPLLPRRVPPPVHPAQPALRLGYLLRPLDEALEVQLQALAAMEIAESGKATQEVSNEDVKFQGVGQAGIELQACRRQELDPQASRLGRHRQEIPAGQDREAVLQDSGPAVVDRSPIMWTAVLAVDVDQCVFPLGSTEPDAPKLAEGIDEVREVVDPLTDEDEAEGEDTARFVDRGRVKRGFQYEGVGSVRVFAEDQGVSRRGCFKDIGIRACILQEAGWALAVTNDAGDLSEDMAEATAEGGALVLGKAEPVLRFKRDCEAGHPERIEPRCNHGLLLPSLSGNPAGAAPGMPACGSLSSSLPGVSRRQNRRGHQAGDGTGDGRDSIRALTLSSRGKSAGEPNHTLRRKSQH
jgi:hypothetical protein